MTLYGEKSMIDENAIMVYINRLRQKIEDTPTSPRIYSNGSRSWLLICNTKNGLTGNSYRSNLFIK